jgi:hypothetical protein
MFNVLNTCYCLRNFYAFKLICSRIKTNWLIFGTISIKQLTSDFLFIRVNQSSIFFIFQYVIAVDEYEQASQVMGNSPAAKPPNF